MTLASDLQDMRIKLGLSIAEAETRSGISFASIEALEAGGESEDGSRWMLAEAYDLYAAGGQTVIAKSDQFYEPWRRLRVGGRR